MHRYKFARDILGGMMKRYKGQVPKDGIKTWQKRARKLGNDARAYLRKRHLGDIRIDIQTEGSLEHFVVSFDGTRIPSLVDNNDDCHSRWIGMVIPNDGHSHLCADRFMIEWRVVRKLRNRQRLRLDEANEEYDEMLRAQELWEAS